MSVEPRSPVERDIIEMSLESVKKGGNQHIVRKDDDDEKLTEKRTLNKSNEKQSNIPLYMHSFHLGHSIMI